MNYLKFLALIFSLLIASCSGDETTALDNVPAPTAPQGPRPGQGEGGASSNDGSNQPDNPSTTDALFAAFGNTIDLGNLPNYANQPTPNYIDEDNSRGADITDEGALLGRVLFYDNNLSVDNTISCASCHQQEHAFSDINRQSTGVAGLTGRHSMRLINVQYASETRFFWDERANTLEDQTIMPIQDHIEMGFSGENGDPDFNDLIDKLEDIAYYQELFTFVYGAPDISADKMQDALAMFIRSIISFDSRYDQGRSQVNNNNAPFANFSADENQGKTLFMQNPQGGPGGRNGGGLGCNRCHGAPEFDIVPNSRNNGVIGIIGNPGARDLTITRSPTLRDLFDANGNLNSPLMHTGDFNINRMVDHYDNIPNNNPNLDNRLGGANGRTQRLNISEEERNNLIAFLRTLSGRNVYEDQKWSNPFR